VAIVNLDEKRYAVEKMYWEAALASYIGVNGGDLRKLDQKQFDALIDATYGSYAQTGTIPDLKIAGLETSKAEVMLRSFHTVFHASRTPAEIADAQNAVEKTSNPAREIMEKTVADLESRFAGLQALKNQDFAAYIEQLQVINLTHIKTVLPDKDAQVKYVGVVQDAHDHDVIYHTDGKIHKPTFDLLTDPKYGYLKEKDGKLHWRDEAELSDNGKALLKALKGLNPFNNTKAEGPYPITPPGLQFNEPLSLIEAMIKKDVLAAETGMKESPDAIVATIGRVLYSMPFKRQGTEINPGFYEDIDKRLNAAGEELDATSKGIEEAKTAGRDFGNYADIKSYLAGIEKTMDGGLRVDYQESIAQLRDLEKATVYDVAASAGKVYFFYSDVLKNQDPAAKADDRLEVAHGKEGNAIVAEKDGRPVTKDEANKMIWEEVVSPYTKVLAARAAVAALIAVNSADDQVNLNDVAKKFEHFQPTGNNTAISGITGVDEIIHRTLNNPKRQVTANDEARDTGFVIDPLVSKIIKEVGIDKLVEAANVVKGYTKFKPDPQNQIHINKGKLKDELDRVLPELAEKLGLSGKEAGRDTDSPAPGPTGKGSGVKSFEAVAAVNMARTQSTTTRT